MKYLWPALGLIGLLVTGPKVVRMAQIKGWLPGASARVYPITQKWEEVRDDGQGDRRIYWISWTERSVQEVGDHRLNLERAQWDALAVGDSIEIVRVPGDRWPHVRNGIFVQLENFVLDFVLLGIELWLVWTGIRLLRRRRGTTEGVGTA
jgi:hypothetical protein